MKVALLATIINTCATVDVRNDAVVPGDVYRCKVTQRGPLACTEDRGNRDRSCF